jgi:uncharacterized protein (TIGR02118 family)
VSPIKVLAGAIKHPVNRTQEEFHRYWQTLHGPMFAHTPELRRYVQHHTLAEAYAGEPRPTLHGASMFWYDDLDVLRTPQPSPKLGDAIGADEPELYEWYVASNRYGDAHDITVRENTLADDRQLFDRTPDDWPRHDRRTSIVAHERVVIDGQTTPEMVKVIWAALRKPGLSVEEFQQHWFDVHGCELGSKVPGVRRYVQNHVPIEAYGVRQMTHDGWTEMWFDDLESMRRARQSPEWQRLGDDGQTLFSYPMAVVVAREVRIK